MTAIFFFKCYLFFPSCHAFHQMYIFLLLHSIRTGRSHFCLFITFFRSKKFVSKNINIQNCSTFSFVFICIYITAYTISLNRVGNRQDMQRHRQIKSISSWSIPDSTIEKQLHLCLNSAFDWPFCLKVWDVVATKKTSRIPTTTNNTSETTKSFSIHSNIGIYWNRVCLCMNFNGSSVKRNKKQ